MLVRSRATMVVTAMLLSTTAPRGLTASGAVPAIGNGPTPTVTIGRVAQAATIDGALDDVAWREAPWFPLTFETTPGENVPAPVRTEVAMVHTGTHLFVAFRCFDPEARRIRANYSDRDHIDTNDRVAVELDTFSDKRRAFVFGVNALGVQWDAIHTGGSYDSSWDAIWDSAGRRYDWGYVVEMAIPFDQLRFPRHAGAATWGLGVTRVYPRGVEHTLALSPRDRNNNCEQCQWFQVAGPEGVSPGRNLELAPTVTGVRSDARTAPPDGSFAATARDLQAGASTKWGVTPNLTAQGTINPDFSQVEADALQLDINQPFALFYPEKRPFFTEGADYFDPLVNRVIENPITLVATRTIRDPQWGVKVTGKEGANVIGALSVRDALTNIVVPGVEQSSTVSLPTANYSSVFRYRRDLGSNYSLGTTATSREGEDYFNRLVGIDGDLRFTKHDRILFTALESSTRYPGEVARDAGQPDGTFSDRLWMVHYRHDTRNYALYGDYQDIGTGFRADLGYVPRVGLRKGEVGGSYTWWGRSTSFVNRVKFDGNLRDIHQQDGRKLQHSIEMMASVHGPMQSTAFVYYGARDRVYDGTKVPQDFKGLYLSIRPSNTFFVNSGVAYEDKIDYDNNRPASEFKVEQQLALQATAHLRWSLDYTYLTLDVAGGRLFRVHAFDTGLTYQLNRRTFVRAVAQYTDTAQTQTLYRVPVAPESRALYLQGLWSYMLNPRTVVFLGYSGNLTGEPPRALLQQDRTLFLKLGYALTR